MKTINAETLEVDSLVAIEKDLASARRGARFQDALHHLDEIFVVYKHTESDAVRSRCAALLSAPETSLQAA